MMCAARDPEGGDQPVSKLQHTRRHAEECAFSLQLSKAEALELQLATTLIQGLYMVCFPPLQPDMTQGDDDETHDNISRIPL